MNTQRHISLKLLFKWLKVSAKIAVIIDSGAFIADRADGQVTSGQYLVCKPFTKMFWSEKDVLIIIRICFNRYA